MNRLSRSMILVLLASVLIACGQAGPPAAAPGAGAPVSGVTAPASRAGWEQQWETALAEAKKEGSLSIYIIGWGPDLRKAISQAFEQKYGINIEFSPFARGQELLAKVQAEQRAGLYVADVFGVGGSTTTTELKPAGLLGPISPLLILPEATDPKSWSGDKFPFLDKDQRVIAFLSGRSSQIIYNTELMPKGEISSYRDLLKPQYKGKMTLNDPTMSGAGNAFFSNLAANIWNVEEAQAFLRQLIKQQDVFIQRDNRLHVETVARGKYPIGVAPNADSLNSFLDLGAPIGIAIAREGTYAGPSSGCVGVSIKPAHPSATAVFLNWLLTKEGQTLFSRNFRRPSLRTDVPLEGFLPHVLPQPGEKVFLESEETILVRAKMLGVAKQVIDETTK